MVEERSLKSVVDRSFPDSIETDSVTEDSYFQHNVPPSNLSKVESQINDFVAHHKILNNKVAVVSSGGTTVPLENNTVRFIDNFSAGTRGSLSAEYLLKHGYAVIFLYREFSLRPFSQHYSQKPILDWLEIDEISGEVKVKSDVNDRVKQDLTAHKSAVDTNMLIEIPFTTVNEYLYYLRSLGYGLQPLGKSALFYLTAAVSDFFLPMSKISEHKIQSNGMAKLVVDLDPVPKILKSLVNQWTPAAMVVSFKLETDKTILLSKCHGALKNYGHQVVIGNLLQTRKDEVFIVTPTSEDHVQNHSNGVIEEKFLPKILEMHKEYISN